MPSEFFLRSRRVVTPKGVRAATIHIQNGVIAEVMSYDYENSAMPREDLGDLVIMPGLVDIHVHLNEPGRTEWEGFETGTKAAAAGGVTTLVDMPLNSTPVTTTLTALQEKRQAASKKLWVDCGFHAGLIPGNRHELEPLMQAGVLGVKAFLVHSGIDDFPNATEDDLRAAMPIIAKHGVPLLVHAEIETRNNSLLEEGVIEHARASSVYDSADPRSYQAYLASRPHAWEREAIARMIKLCREYNSRVHIVHLASASAIPMIEQARGQSLPLTVETCPHYLFFAAEEIADGDTRFKCAPPMREADNREQLWAALQAGVIDFIASDHSPCPPQMKRLDEGDFMRAWGGIASLQFTLPVMWTAAQQRGVSLFDLSEWLCRRPAQLIGLQNRKGAIAPGYDADLVLWNPEASFTLAASMIHHRHKLTPYEGRKLIGVVEKTLLRGETIYDHGNFSTAPLGSLI
ncbi:allantoinase AllB [candidate division KSB1 bacterium]|nr:allantoinase AllB [candidate division KSB1 bacterium]